MKAAKIRQTFLDFFEGKSHDIVPSAPIVNKDDPTLMFTNAGMNQFKDYFLGNQDPKNPRIADTQKCLRVSGKHNDLEEVGRDSYHHTMFEMLGNWSFGDYFKKEAISWAWELLTKEFGLEPERLYASVFEGDQKEGLEPDSEAADLWKEYLPEERILYFDRKDNFWEMGETGPCGPCSEIHIDLRDAEARKETPGADLVNQDHPLVIEIWNLVFIQFNRKADGSLEPLPAKHVDTGMGFERLCMAVQQKKSNYDTDLFEPFIKKVEELSRKKYDFRYPKSVHEKITDPQTKIDVAMRVVVDHLRAVSFSIADGQLPSNTGAGYVIRRILRRAVRYYYSFLDLQEPTLYKLVPLLSSNFGDTFPGVRAQEEQISKIIQGEEKSFLTTLDNGINRFESLDVKDGKIAGEIAFELYDTFGFPIDLTRLLAVEKGWTVDEEGFETALSQQKERARADAKKEVGDWQEINEGSSDFVGYDQLVVEESHILKHRIVQIKGKPQYQIVLKTTPFYAESGGQRGDKGKIISGDEVIHVIDTQKENDLTIHIVDKLPGDTKKPVTAMVDKKKRNATSQNHSAVHLMHAALHRVLGKHALQKGQDVDSKRLRFDFSHFDKVTDEEIKEVESMVNNKIRENILLEEDRNVPIDEAKAAGALMLFGEKYGDTVRTITFDRDFSMELCGGTHVSATGKIGQFKILSESSVAAGIRRIEAVTAEGAEKYSNTKIQELEEIRGLLKNPRDVFKQVEVLVDENKNLKRQIEQLQNAQAGALKGQLKNQVVEAGGMNVLVSQVPIQDSKALKTLAYQLEKEIGNLVLVFGAIVKDKPQLMVTISEGLTKEKGLHAGNMVRELAKHIQGGGGGQPFFATAGGKNAAGLKGALDAAAAMFKD
ncbi:MAG: alanine--tRNA ligase [Saprospiraceae bacterium]|nr:alanine--tRNA ligase [Saprospiraceae bacterium]